MLSTWSEDDIALLNTMIANKKSFSKIAKALNRSVLAVKYKYGRMYRKKVHRKITLMSYSDSSDSSDLTDKSTDDINDHNHDDTHHEIPDEYAHVHKKHRRTMSEESDPSIYVKYSPKDSCVLHTVCSVFITLVVTFGTCRFVSTLLDSLGKVSYVT